MRFLKVGANHELTLTKDLGTPPASYAILSHTWGPDDEEVTFDDVQSETGMDKTGYAKLWFCANQAKKDGLEYFWVDTCCINKANHVELSEAVTSMFRWYQEAAKCYVYLSDVSVDNTTQDIVRQTWEAAFRSSKWFTRGWTLQELLAPASVEFFCVEGTCLGNKQTLEGLIQQITSIPVAALQGVALSTFTIDERLRWTEGRRTTKVEDQAYSLLGIFGVFMPLMYGEGENAGTRLRREIEAGAGMTCPEAVIPFNRDDDFVERGTILDQIHNQCMKPGSRMALVGLGGVGKSQLAIEYAYRSREQSSTTWIFWVHASNAARLEQSYRDIANRVKISGRQQSKANIFQLVHDWLCDKQKGRWVLILDNVDDAGFLFEARSQGQEYKTDANFDARPLVLYLPQCPHGSILITTRSQQAALKLVEPRDIVSISPMSEVDALILLEKKLGEHYDDSSTPELAAALEFMPLAIVQCSAYIRERAPRCSVRRYLEEFQKSDRKRASLLNFEGGQLRRDVEAKNSIIITWQISFDRIREIRRSAADLLALMSFFDRQGILEALLHRREEAAGSPTHDLDNTSGSYRDVNDDDSSIDDERSTNSNDELEDDIAVLRSYSFIAATATGMGLEMHRLVQLATQKWLEVHGQHERWKQQFISNLEVAFPTRTYKNWAHCQALWPHAKSAMAQKPAAQDSLVKWASLLYKAAWYSLETGSWADVDEMASHAVRTMKEVLGTEHPDTLNGITNLALIYDKQGRWDAAKEMHEQVMVVCQKIFGSDHLNTLTSMMNLASTYRNQGRLDAAEELQVQVMEESKQKLRAEDPDVLASMANLALTYHNQGRWNAAEELQEQVVQISEVQQGLDHPDTLRSRSNLGLTYMSQGKWQAAETILVQVMDITRKELGAEHPDSLTVMVNLASCYEAQGKWDTAEDLLAPLVVMCKERLGTDHPHTLISIGNFALTYWQKGQWDAAEELQVQVMEMSKQRLGPIHPDTLRSMGNLALTYWLKGRWDAAAELQVQVVEKSRQKLGPIHPDTLRSMGYLAMTRCSQGQWHEAESLQVQVMEMYKQILGLNHMETLNSIDTLTLIYQKQERLDPAKRLQEEVTEIRKKALGVGHPDTLKAMHNLAQMHKSQRNFKSAEKLWADMVELRRASLGADHPDTLNSMDHLTGIYRDQGKWAAAEELGVEVMKLREAKLGADHLSTLTTMHNLALTYQSQMNWTAAGELQVKVLNTRRSKQGQDHPETLASINPLVLTYMRQGRWAEVRMLQKEKETLGMKERQREAGRA